MIIQLSEELPFTLQDVWTVIGDPRRADWVPSVTSIEYADNRRTMAMQGAGTITEEIFALDDTNHCIEYGVVESAAPLKHHRAKMQLTALTEQSTRLDWQTEIKPDAFGEFIEQGMQGGIQGLLTVLSR